MYFVVLMGAVPSIANGFVSVFDQVPPPLRRVGAALGASRLQQARLIVLPAAPPGYLAGLKQGWAISWCSPKAAETIATGGSLGFRLGALLQQSRQRADLPGVPVTIFVTLALGIVVERVVFAPIERREFRGRGLLAETPQSR